MFFLIWLEGSSSADDAGYNYYVYSLLRVGDVSTGPVCQSGWINFSRNWSFHRSFRHMDGQGVHDHGHI